MKYLRLIAASLFMFVLIVGIIFLVVEGYMSGEIMGFGRGNHNEYTLQENPQSYWSNLLVWAGLVILFIVGCIMEIVRTIKEINNS